MRRFSLILLFVFALAGAAFAADDVIKIGVFNRLTGQNVFFAASWSWRARSWRTRDPFEVLGKKAELSSDNKSDKVEAGERGHAADRARQGQRGHRDLRFAGYGRRREVAEKAGSPSSGRPAPTHW